MSTKTKTKPDPTVKLTRSTITIGRHGAIFDVDGADFLLSRADFDKLVRRAEWEAAQKDPPAAPTQLPCGEDINYCSVADGDIHPGSVCCNGNTINLATLKRIQRLSHARK